MQPRAEDFVSRLLSFLGLPRLPMSDETSQALIAAGRVFPGAHVCESQLHDLLQSLAREHATYQARLCQQGHQRFQSRFDAIYKSLGLWAAEIAAESWERQANDSLPEIGVEMFRCWRQSPGHWRVASRKHELFGADMAQGRNGVWYACILVADNPKVRGDTMSLDLSLFAKLLALLKAGIPTPAFSDAAAVEKWLVGLAPSEAALIAAVVSQFKAKGLVELALPNGETITLARSCDGGCDCCVTDEDAAKVCAAAPEAFDGKWLEALKKAIALIPQIMAILALFKTKDEPTPTPPINS